MTRFCRSVCYSLRHSRVTSVTSTRCVVTSLRQRCDTAADHLGYRPVLRLGMREARISAALRSDAATQAA